MNFLYNTKNYEDWTYQEYLEMRREMGRLHNIVVGWRRGPARLANLNWYWKDCVKDIKNYKTDNFKPLRAKPTTTGKRLLRSLIEDYYILEFRQYKTTWNFAGIVEGVPAIKCAAFDHGRKNSPDYTCLCCPLWRRIFKHHTSIKRNWDKVLPTRVRPRQHKYEMIEVESRYYHGNKAAKGYFVFDPYDTEARLQSTMKKAKEDYEAKAAARVAAALNA